MYGPIQYTPEDLTTKIVKAARYTMIWNWSDSRAWPKCDFYFLALYDSPPWERSKDGKRAKHRPIFCELLLTTEEVGQIMGGS